MCVERVEQGTQTQPCGAPTFRVMELEVNWPFSPLWSAGEEVLDPVTECSV